MFLLMLKVTVVAVTEKCPVELFSSGRLKLWHNLGTLPVMKNQ